MLCASARRYHVIMWSCPAYVQSFLCCYPCYLASGLATAVGMSLLRLPSVVIDTVHRPLKAKCVFSSVMQLWRKCAVCNSHSSEVPQVVADFL